MRELTVFYCSQCGYYAYYQLPKNAVCPKCSASMTKLPMTYQNFMNLDYEMRDELIGSQILGDAVPNCSVVQRITEPERQYNSRAVIAKQAVQIRELTQEVERLRDDNKKLNDTVTWMHATNLGFDNEKQKADLTNTDSLCRRFSGKKISGRRLSESPSHLLTADAGIFLLRIVISKFACRISVLHHSPLFSHASCFPFSIYLIISLSSVCFICSTVLKRVSFSLFSLSTSFIKFSVCVTASIPNPPVFAIANPVIAYFPLKWK